MSEIQDKSFRVTYGIPGTWATDGNHTVEATYALPDIERATSVADYIADANNLVVINVEEVVHDESWLAGVREAGL